MEPVGIHNCKYIPFLPSLKHHLTNPNFFCPSFLSIFVRLFLFIRYALRFASSVDLLCVADVADKEEFSQHGGFCDV